MFDDNFMKRFFEKVDFTENLTTCWIWTACLNSKGYGLISINGELKLAHRISFMLKNGEIPKGMVIMHTCDNRKCVNPEHLRMGTIGDNNKDMVEKGRQAKGEKNGRAKLTYKQVECIRKLYADGDHSYKYLAHYFGVSRWAIGSIIKEEFWKLPLVE